MSDAPDSKEKPESDVPARRDSPGDSSGQPELPDSADGLLPPVQAPSAGFILQLFLIPAIIVSIIVLVWLTFSWLAHMGSNPQKLVQDLNLLNDASWQKASTLADLLRNSEYEELKTDPKLASDLAKVLYAQTNHVETAQTKKKGYDERLRLRIFLCRALGELHIPDGFYALINAAIHEEDTREIAVRRAAIEAIAILSRHVTENSGRDVLEKYRHEIDEETSGKSKEFYDYDRLIESVISAAENIESSDDSESRQQRGDLRATAVFALGVLGGDKAMESLEQSLSDPHDNTRYNAAIALARNGKLESTAVLVEMLDPENEAVVASEKNESGQDWKRKLVITNALKVVEQLVTKDVLKDSPEHSASLKEALEKLTKAEVPSQLRSKADDILEKLSAVE